MSDWRCANRILSLEIRSGTTDTRGSELQGHRKQESREHGGQPKSQWNWDIAGKPGTLVCWEKWDNKVDGWKELEIPLTSLVPTVPHFLSRGAQESALMPLQYPSHPTPISPDCRSCFWKQECPSAPQPDHWETKQRCLECQMLRSVDWGWEGWKRILASKSLGTCSCILPYNHHQGKKYRVQTPGTNI